jgi:hydrogenase nickel incorporation protein HypA/HybF
MHELSLIQGVTDTVKESAIQNNIRKVKKVKLVVGKFSMALPDSMQFAFEAIASTEPLLDGAVLEIENRPIICQCGKCGQKTEIDDNYRFVCSGCGSAEVEIVQGRELYLDYYEGE